MAQASSLASCFDDKRNPPTPNQFAFELLKEEPNGAALKSGSSFIKYHHFGNKSLHVTDKAHATIGRERGNVLFDVT
jgi:hypothetical protein